jgi:hypothetical protein
MPATPGSTAVPVPVDLHAPPPAGARLPSRRGCRWRPSPRAPRRLAQVPAVSLLLVSVDGEVGKTMLLAAFGKLFASAGMAPLQLDGRDGELSSASFVGALRRELGLDPDASPIGTLHAGSGQRVLLIERIDEGATASAAESATPPPAASESCLRANERELVTAVRAALRHFTSPDLLGHNPLVHSRLVAERAGAEAGSEARVAALQALVREVVGSLGASPRRAKLQRALYHTFIEPAGSQERVAELLDLPFSTYRDHLKAGIQLVGEIVRQRETSERLRPALEPSTTPAHPTALMGT